MWKHALFMIPVVVVAVSIFFLFLQEKDIPKEVSTPQTPEEEEEEDSTPQTPVEEGTTREIPVARVTVASRP